MAGTDVNQAALKQAIKEALAETLQKPRELLHEVFAEVLEDFAVAEAISEGQETNIATREEVFRILQGEAWRPPFARASLGT